MSLTHASRLVIRRLEYSEQVTLPELHKAIHSLKFPVDDYLLFGTAPMLVPGLLAQINDLDILAKGRAWEAATKLAKPVPMPDGDLAVRFESVDIFNGWMKFDVASRY